MWRRRTLIIAVCIIILAIVLTTLIYRSKKQDTSSSWISLGGWSINVISQPSSPMNLQYDFIGVREPRLPGLNILFKDKGVKISYVHTQASRAVNNVDIYHVSIDGSFVYSVKNEKWEFQIRTHYFTKTIPYGNATIQIDPHPVTWLDEVSADGGTQGAYHQSHVYADIFKNRGSVPVKILGLEQAGNYHIGKLYYTFSNQPPTETIPRNAKPIPVTGVTVTPSATITIYCNVTLPSKTDRNIYFQPALHLKRGTVEGLQMLLPTQWIEMYTVGNPIRTIPGAYVKFDK